MNGRFEIFSSEQTLKCLRTCLSFDVDEIGRYNKNIMLYNHICACNNGCLHDFSQLIKYHTFIYSGDL